MTTFTGTARRCRAKRVPTDDGRGIKVIADGIEQGDIELEIDVRALIARLGPHALANKSRKAKLAGGLIVAKASNIKWVS